VDGSVVIRSGSALLHLMGLLGAQSFKDGIEEAFGGLALTHHTVHCRFKGGEVVHRDWAVFTHFGWGHVGRMIV
jgi:hypothetical protein